MIKGGPDKPLENLKGVISFLKRLSKATEKYFPYTSTRLKECVIILRQIKFQENKHG